MKLVERLETAVARLEAISGVSPEGGGDVAAVVMVLSIVAFDDLMGEYVGRNSAAAGRLGDMLWT